MVEPLDLWSFLAVPSLGVRDFGGEGGGRNPSGSGSLNPFGAQRLRERGSGSAGSPGREGFGQRRARERRFQRLGIHLSCGRDTGRDNRPWDGMGWMR